MRNPNFEFSCPTFKCRMRRFGNSSQRFAPNVPTFRQNFRANLTNFIQNLFWRLRFSNEDFKMVEDLLAWRSSRFELECSWINILLRVLDVRREAKRFISASNLNELKEKVRPDTLKVQGVYLALPLGLSASWDRPRPAFIY